MTKHAAFVVEKTVIHEGYHCLHVPVYSTALNAEQYAEVDGGPFGVYTATVCTSVITWDIQELETQRVTEKRKWREGGGGGVERGRGRGRERGERRMEENRYYTFHPIHYNYKRQLSP